MVTKQHTKINQRKTTPNIGLEPATSRLPRNIGKYAEEIKSLAPAGLVN